MVKSGEDRMKCPQTPPGWFGLRSEYVFAGRRKWISHDKYCENGEKKREKMRYRRCVVKWYGQQRRTRENSSLHNTEMSLQKVKLGARVRTIYHCVRMWNFLLIIWMEFARERRRGQSEVIAQTWTHFCPRVGEGTKVEIVLLRK